MTARGLPVLVSSLAAGVVGGSCLAALAHAPASDPCLDFGALPETATTSGSLELWPFGLRCDYDVGGRLVKSEFFGPSVAELCAWIAAAALLAAFALLRRGSAAARGAAAAAVLLAAIGACWQYAGVQLAIYLVVMLGVVLALAVDHLLRPPEDRSIRDSLPVAAAVATGAFCAIVEVVFIPVVGIAFGVLAGALASYGLARPRPRRAG